ncbi:hypothetical protein BU24DRAFT_487710 [Aaosphaeria arxii CBS 175.79]|uniref:AB hydrolase-1 domain-containing protein n=1 Tax=Aaosphaeria arxii CBS 175.79 TaxID=1450172 RepID=A0A6A5Y7I5_9PLEO|nr:uncharacterized protein BU24DRAFT_487710 [Aaosphaeria arxii CBS 175.79]KAF2021256.1 hypothetical protein BU24DRAFT_487710 [Aaosphaeria arxii CBS 175.79]
MRKFQFKLANNGTVAGIHSIPPTPATAASKERPLVVGLHGGCYDSQYFDATPRFSASQTSIALGIPFVAIDRPSYGGTSSILPIPDDSDFAQETGIWLHQYILPKLWEELGAPNGCNCIVLLCHSLGTMGGIVTAALHAKDTSPLYPLGALIASGMGDTQSEFMLRSPPSFTMVGSTHAMFPPDSKDSVMFKPDTVADEVLEQCQRLNAVCPLAETAKFAPAWLPTWKQQWAKDVTAPVMFALVEDDPFFVTTEEELKKCTDAFGNDVRVDGSLIRGAPHCMELSYWSQGWYARCFGFALECSVSFAGPRRVPLT